MGCEPLMNKFGFRWPESLDCTRFPEEECLPSYTIDAEPEVNNTYLYGNYI